MFKTSINYIKEQLPGIEVTDILAWYVRELENSSVTAITMGEDAIYFSTSGFGGGRFRGKFAQFKKGEIRVYDGGDRWEVMLEADTGAMPLATYVGAVTAVLFLLITKNIVGSLFIGGLLLVAVMVSRGIRLISFPVYFKNLQYQLEQEWKECSDLQ